MSQPKTSAHDGDVTAFIDGVEHAGRREDAHALRAVMEELTGEKACMWGASIVGFGSYHYVYASGREGDWPLVGFSPRKSNLVLYIMPGFEAYADLLSRLGKHRTGKSCLYLTRLAKVDMDVLRELIVESVKHTRATHSAE